MKQARQLLDELLAMAAPPAGVTITIFERPGRVSNWISSLPGSIPLGTLSRYQEACAAFRKTDHQIDWSEVPGANGERQLSKQQNPRYRNSPGSRWCETPRN
jgi:hypothetical protein